MYINQVQAPTWGNRHAVDGSFDSGNPVDRDPFDVPYIRHDGKYAQNARATLARSAWEDYLTRFQPVEEMLVDGVMNPEEWLDNRLSSIRASSDRAFGAAARGADMLRGRYGIQQTAQEARQNESNAARSEALATIDAVNNTRRHMSDRNMAVIGGGSGGTRNAIQEM